MFGITRKLNALLRQGEQIMAQYDDIKAANARTHAALSAHGTSLTGIAADIRALKDAVQPGMTEAQAEELKTDAEAVATAVETAVAAVASLDAENPPVE